MPSALAASTSAPTAPASERRLVSVLFADLVGFTPFAEERDAEDVRETLTRYFDLAREVIERYGGTVEKFIGDAVMAVWGAPTAHEDDAERAVRAALDLVAAVKTLGPALQARAGVMTGEAAVTLGAVGQGLVAGDLVNTASRLQTVASPGTVLVGEATQRAASRAIVFEPAGEQLLKGKAAPVAAWRALRVVAERGGRNRAETLEAPFVGRDDELRLLKELFHATSRERRARLVSVIGPAGIGKTRLGWEFEKYLDGLVEQVWWHRGRSPAYGDGITFWALGEMVRGRAGLVETDDEATTRAKIAAMVAVHVPDPEERHWIESSLLALLGLDAGISSEQLFGAWRAFFERLAATSPVVMVFEDFQYADAGLIEFVEQLLEWSRNLPIYVVTLARPDLIERRPTWGAGTRNFTSLYLEPLSEAAMRDLLAGLVPGLPEPVIRAIVARAGGVPLYAVETVRMLVAEGRLAEHEGAYRAVGELASLAVPETLSALIASRLDALPSDDRALVADAAVLGQSFTVAALAAVSGTAAADLEPRLRGLVRRELLTLEADPRSPERGQYAFVQALIREVAYSTLSKRDRKSRHLAAARFFESLGSDELAGALAGQYLAAYRTSGEGAESEALSAQARIALRAAAERALALGSPDQALAFFEQAIEVASADAERADLHERAGAAATQAGRSDSAERNLRLALQRYGEAGDQRGVTRATALLGRAFTNSGRAGDAVAMLSQPSPLDEQGAEPSIASRDAELARAYFMHDEPELSIETADRALRTAERLGLVAVVADTLVTKGTVLVELARWHEGFSLIEGGRQLAETSGLVWTEVRALTNSSSMLVVRDPRRALDLARRGLATAQRMGLRSILGSLFVNAASAARRTGDWEWVMSAYESLDSDQLEPADRAEMRTPVLVLKAARGVAVGAELAKTQAEMLSVPDQQPVALAGLARAFVLTVSARYAEAADEYFAAAQASSVFTQWALPAAGRSAVLARDLERARDAVRELDALGISGPALAADVGTILAGCAALEGDEAEAAARYRRALSAWRDLGLPWDEALCALEMATLLDPAGHGVQGAADAARETFHRLAATPFVEQLDAVLSHTPNVVHVANPPTERAASVPTRSPG
jgi:class 3 adenylate cyclase/tetratricopeptide (TPR) repeat protein